MYKGYDDKRKFLNSKLHGLSVKICGSREVLEQEIYHILSNRALQPGANDSISKASTNSISVTMLSDAEADTLYNKLLSTFRNVRANMKATEKLLGNAESNLMSLEQRKKIIRILKYKFNWPLEVSFSKILEICPELAKRMTPWHIQNNKIIVLYSLMTKKQADKVIRRLERIEHRNEEHFTKSK